MKLQSKQWMLAAILFASINVSAQTIVPLDENAMYFTADELPDATVWLPAPPDTLSTKFVYDVTQYMWGKTQREDPQRAQQAIDNVVIEASEMAEQFSVPFGMEISREKTK
jgi:acid phosphatase (class A)